MQFNIIREKIFDFLKSDPNFCALTGISQSLGDLPDPGKNKRISNQGKLKMLKNTLAKVDVESLSFDDKIDFELAGLILEQSRLSYELDLDGIPHNMRMPKASDLIIDPLFMFYINDFRDPKMRLVNIISRLDKTPDFITSYIRNINKPVQRWVDIELEKLNGLPTFFENIITWANQVEFKNIDALKKVINKTNSSLLKYKDFLINTPKSKNIFIGEDQLKEVLASRGIKLSPEKLHSIAFDFTQENISSTEKLKNSLISKYKLNENTSHQELQDFLNDKFKVKRDTEDFSYILKRYQLENSNIMSFIEDKKLFPVMDNQEMLIMQTPKFMEPTIPAGAMMPPLSFREGTRKSLVYLTLSEDLLAEHTELSIPGMMIHEGIPGHHLQLSWGSLSSSYLRKVLDASDMFEGWTTMLEDYMLDIGYCAEYADEVRYIAKRDIARIGARVAIDLYFMSGNKKYLDLGYELDFNSEDPFVNAAKLLKHQTGFVDARVEAEINWYSQERGYPLSYLTGNYLVWELKKKFSDLYKSKVNSSIEVDREFHKRFLTAGNMPISVLEKIVLKDL